MRRSAKRAKAVAILGQHQKESQNAVHTLEAQEAEATLARRTLQYIVLAKLLAC